MPSFFSRLKSKDGPTKASKKKGAQQTTLSNAPPKPRWEDAWTRKTVDPDEVQELLRGCTLELKSKGTFLSYFYVVGYASNHGNYIVLHRLTGFPLIALDMPFLLLPFRPTSDPSATRSFIRNFFDRNQQMHGVALAQELRLTEPMVRIN